MAIYYRVLSFAFQGQHVYSMFIKLIAPLLSHNENDLTIPYMENKFQLAELVSVGYEQSR